MIISGRSCSIRFRNSHKICPAFYHTTNKSMYSSRTAHGLRLEELSPNSSTTHSGTVIFMHGLGDTAFGWLPVFEQLQPLHPHLKFILPTAPSIPVTCNFGTQMPAWYDIVSLSERKKETAEGIDGNAEAIRSIIQDEITKGINPSRIMLGGFSQGGALSLYVTYRLAHVLAGVVALSCYLPKFEDFSKNMTDVGKKTPLFMCHGDMDGVVKLDYGRKSFEVLQEVGVKGKWTVYRGLDHGAHPQEIRDMSDFIMSKLPPISSSTL